MSELKMLTIQQLITKEAILFIHKVLFNERPSSILKFVTYGVKESQGVRKVCKPRIKYEHNSDKVRQSLLYRSVFLYGLLDYELRFFIPKKLSKYLQENIIYIFPHDKILKQKIEN